MLGAASAWAELTSRAQTALSEALEMYKQMLAKSNTTFGEDDLPPSIMFCPSAIHVLPDRSAAAVSVVPSR